MGWNKIYLNCAFDVQTISKPLKLQLPYFLWTSHFYYTNVLLCKQKLVYLALHCLWILNTSQPLMIRLWHQASQLEHFQRYIFSMVQTAFRGESEGTAIIELQMCERHYVQEFACSPGDNFHVHSFFFYSKIWKQDIFFNTIIFLLKCTIHVIMGDTVFKILAY